MQGCTGCVLLLACVLRVSAASTGLLVWYGNGMYLPENSVFTNASLNADLLTFVTSSTIAPLNVSTLHVQTQGVRGAPGLLSTAAGRDLIQTFIQRASSKSRSVSLLFGWTKAYEDSTGWGSVAAAAAAALNFSLMAAHLASDATPASSRPVAITLDIEPNPAELDQYQQLADLLLTMRAQLDGMKSKIPLISTTSFLFSQRFVNCGSHGANLSLTECVASVADSAVLMDFRTKSVGPNSIVSQAMDTLAAASNRGSTASLCLETNVEVPASISFQGTSVQQLTLAMQQAQQALHTTPVFSSLGTDAFVIEDWVGLRQLVSAPPPPPPPPPSDIEVVLVNQASVSVTVKQVLSSHSKGGTLCTVAPGGQCTVGADFQVFSVAAAGDAFDSWWGDDSYKQAHVTLAVSVDPHAKGYLVYTQLR